MLFSIDEDAGSRIVGWIMPDNPASTPHVAVFAGGELKKVVSASVLRPLLREQGLHETGICGFVIDEQILSNLSEVQDLELYDDATNIRIYRRRPAAARTDLKFFRLETRLVPQAALNEPFQSLFHMTFTRLDRIPEEAVKSILGIAFTPSIFATGRLYYRAYEPLLRDRGFKCSVLVRDPFEELAEQLLVLRWGVKTPNLAYSVLNEAYRPLVESLSRANVQEMGDLQTWIGTLTPFERSLIASPLARLLTCRGSDDQLETTAVENALDILSEMDVVGLSSEVEAYWDTLAAVLEIPLPEVPPLSWSRQVKELEAQVREWPVVHDLLAADVQLFTDITEVFARADEVTEEAPVATASA
ncbi:hypothetical protein EZH22_19610 [Xanthobacter dioxanivorans]|uniref:Uncharacterized protein n=1 Tax=Xanthobacter dioxanivorans TaxID=2528964 RepID=A0A974SIE5_9HYPH|nr:hypothetical protein [Xanthobacter dioxanivorans]QRG05288.1 hypothetical protein EZH22_19610 [Xanthobacter dioxanivorans]